MTEVNTCDSAVGRASGEDAVALQVTCPLTDLSSQCLPSIVVEPTDRGEVESGELRWPPDDVISTLAAPLPDQGRKKPEAKQIKVIDPLISCVRKQLDSDCVSLS
uniref:LBH domain-containing protein n=1 Tax=Seriola lalandi dorsalis TaxID=1841481 RepID=A0A3B4YYL2_SERLL